MNQDIENPAPPAVATAREAVRAADGIWFFTPEYNFSYPGLLKNLLDWLSRPADPANPTSPSVLAGKKCTVSGVGGRNATNDSRAKLADLLSLPPSHLSAQATSFLSFLSQ